MFKQPTELSDVTLGILFHHCSLAPFTKLRTSPPHKTAAANVNIVLENISSGLVLQGLESSLAVKLQCAEEADYDLMDVMLL